MRGLLIGAVVAVLIAMGGLWLSGGFDAIATWAASEQRLFQNAMARTLRALRGGEPGALALLLGSAFAYGFFHAIGPGHGKLVVGGYGMARAVPVLRLSLIALLGSLGQAVTAIALAYGGLWLFDLGRDRMVGAAEQALAPLSYLFIGAVGLWLALRGVRNLRRQTVTEDHAHQGHAELCSSCGHRHGPSVEEAEQTRSLRDALILIGGIAVRPCTGALFVLIICWQMGIPWAGIAASVAMAVGTATVTVAVALAASGARGGLLRGVSGMAGVAWVMPLVEFAVGLLVLILGLMLFLRVL